MAIAPGVMDCARCGERPNCTNYTICSRGQRPEDLLDWADEMYARYGKLLGRTPHGI